MTERWFPIQGGGRVDWVAAEHAYKHYAYNFGRSQSLERLAERGGFGIVEFCTLYKYGLVRHWPSQEDAARVVLAVADELGPRWQRGGEHG